MAQVTITTSTGADGVRSDALSDWATQRNAATGTVGQSFMHNCDENASSGYLITRLFFYFDLTTTNIPAGSTITGLTFVHPVVGNKTVNDSASVHLSAHTAANPPVSASYNDLTLNGDTSWGTETMANLSTSVATNITMNAAAITAANTAIGTEWKVLLRGSKDFDNSEPPNLNEYSFTLDNTQLIVDYTVPASGFLAIL